jgi:gas vesicle protein GvpG
MFIVDSLLFGGLKFVLSKIAAAVDAELDEEAVLREELLAAQMRLELGEITEAEFATVERSLLEAMRDTRARRRGADADSSGLKVTGIEADVWTGHDDEQDERAGPSHG